MYKKHEELLINWKHLFQKEGENYRQESAKPLQIVPIISGSTYHTYGCSSVLISYLIIQNWVEMSWSMIGQLY